MENNNAAPEAVKTPEEVKPEAVPAAVPAQDVKEETVTITKAKLDEILAANETITQIAEKKASDAENYKKGMLVAKNKLKDAGFEEDEEPEERITKQSIADAIKEAVAEQLKATAQPVKDDELEALKKKNEEMRRAFINTSQTPQSNTSMGSNQDKPEVKKSFFAPEDEAELRQRALRIGVDPEKFLESIKGNLDNPGAWRPVASKRFQNL